MLDVSFTEILVVGVVALVVIGPERLPKVARTLGHLAGRAQRYVNDVKSDIQREVELGDLKQIKEQMEEAAQSVQSSLKNTEASIRNPIESIEKETMDAFHAIDSNGLTQGLSDQTSEMGEAASDFHKVAPYVTVGSHSPLSSTIVTPYQTIGASPATQLEPDAVHATAETSPSGSTL